MMVLSSESYTRNAQFTAPYGNPSPGTLGGSGGSVGAGEEMY